MNKENTIYYCPQKRDKLFKYSDDSTEYLLSESGARYEFYKQFPNLTYPKQLEGKARVHFDFFENLADDYDKYFYQTFKTFGEDESATRNGFIDLLKIGPDSKVLEVGCGTGRDSELIAKRLGQKGLLVLLDISPSMLSVCRNRLSQAGTLKTFCLANAEHLPFASNYFDAVYCFTAVQYFTDMKRGLAEMTRVTRTGGKIVFGDHSMPPWLRNTEFCRILSSNPGILAELPLHKIPVEARKVTLRWVIGSIFYLIDFEAGVGEPTGNFDYEIEGTRGGTLRTRYEGQLEGVTKEAKALALKAVAAKKQTMHKWLDEVVKEAAIRDLKL